MKKLIFLAFLLISFVCFAGTYGGGSGTLASPYLIATTTHFSEITTTTADWTGKYFKQTANLDFTGAGEIENIGSQTTNFTGTYDGDGYTISNIDVDDTPDSYNHVAIFNKCGSGASIKNLTVLGALVNGSSPEAHQAYTAILVGENAYGASIENCNVNGTLVHVGTDAVASSYQIIGMIAGSNHGSITNCTASGTLTVSSSLGGTDMELRVGGLVGYQTGGASASQLGYTLGGYSTVDISVASPVSNMVLGGIVGSVAVSSTNINYIQNCHFRGTITYADGTEASSIWVGGICGNAGSIVSDCSTKGTMSIGYTDSAGGQLARIGGAFGAVNATGNVDNCFADIDMTITPTDETTLIYSGGFMGNSTAGGTVSYCYSRGSITDGNSGTSALSIAYYGGFDGVMGTTSIDHCFAIMDAYSDVAGNAMGFAGGGSAGGQTACFWDATTSGMAADDAQSQAVSHTTAEMQTASTFSDYTFGTGTYLVLTMPDYPVLTYQYSGGAGTASHPWKIETQVDWLYALSDTYSRTDNEYFSISDSFSTGFFNVKSITKRKTGALHYSLH